MKDLQLDHVRAGWEKSKEDGFSKADIQGLVAMVDLLWQAIDIIRSTDQSSALN